MEAEKRLLLDVPYHRQETPNSCWYAALAMVLEFHKRETPDLKSTKAYQDSLRWDLGELDEYIIEGSGFGIRQTAKDFETVGDLMRDLKEYGPMWVPAKQTNHVVVIVGASSDGKVYYHDPGPKEGTGKNLQFAFTKMAELFPVYLQYGIESDAD